MSRKRSSRTHNPFIGSSPGSLCYIGEYGNRQVSVRLHRIGAHGYHEENLNPSEIQFERKAGDGLLWLDVTGVHDSDFMETIGERFQLHPLVLEDLMNSYHDPKCEEHDDYVVILAKILRFELEELSLTLRHVGIIFGKDFVVSFHEADEDPFRPIRERLRKPNGRLRSQGADYLAYALLDCLVDSYFIALERCEDSLVGLDGKILESTDENTLLTLHKLKQEVFALRRIIRSTRELVSSFQQISSKLLRKTTYLFLRDLQDHVNQLSSATEYASENIASLMELNLSLISRNTNDVMKVLTTLTSIFIPITFIVGVYGMNFRVMPELDWRYGYAGVWALMLLTVLLTIGFLRRRGWW